MSGKDSIYDLVLRGGRVVDPASGLDAIRDVAIANGAVAEISDAIEDQSSESLDVSGLIVAPGLIDLHVHVYFGSTYWGVRPDDVGRKSGTTTMLDAGSAGSYSYRGFVEFIVVPSKIRILGLINLSSNGLVGRHGELLDPAHADVEGAAEAIREFPDVFLGAKIRNGAHIIGEGDQGRRHCEMAIEVAERGGTFLMTHISNPPIPMSEWLGMLRPRDIVTHSFRTGENNLFDDDNQLIPAAWDARERGVIFDLGHGAGSFELARGRAALDQGFHPDTISTDLHVGNVNGPVYDMPTTMGKMQDLGLTLNDVIRRSTSEAARAIGMEDTLGSLQVGREADIAVLAAEEGPVEYMDSYGTTWTGNHTIRAVHTIRAGEVL
jgi:dihydroorotase